MGHLLPHFERIKSAQQWQALGLWQAEDAPRRAYRLWPIEDVGPAEREAIESGKRRAPHFHQMLEYLDAGIPFGEFTAQPEHVRAYCFGRIAQAKGRHGVAVDLLRKAVAGNPTEVRYLEAFYRVRLAAGDDSGIEEELSEFANEADALVHSGRVDEWLRMLLKARQYERAAAIVIRVDSLLGESLSGTRPSGRYSGQSQSWVASKRARLRERIERWRSSARYRPFISAIDKTGGFPSWAPDAGAAKP